MDVNKRLVRIRNKLNYFVDKQVLSYDYSREELKGESEMILREVNKALKEGEINGNSNNK